MKTLAVLCLFIFLSHIALAKTAEVEVASERLGLYLPLLKNKRVGVFINASSRVVQERLLDVLIKHHIQVVKIFAPEHGLYTDRDVFLSDAVDTKTGIPIVSLYGKKLKPSAEDLKDVDILLFDIQDVGVRFYTYLASLQKLMEAAADNQKPLIILDRPNPNGFYIDGPGLDLKYSSFTGMQNIPLVYGMTIGEYAKMLVGESWLNMKDPKSLDQFKLTVIPVLHYTHAMHYVPPQRPSPSLVDIQSIYWYPAIGIMEGTVMSVGRGTSTPFQVFGHPHIQRHFEFTPKASQIAPDPDYLNTRCYGWDLRASPSKTLEAIDNQFQLKYLIEAYQAYPDKEHFFSKGFVHMSGSPELANQIQANLSETEIRSSWQAGIAAFKKIRSQYLLYPDFPDWQASVHPISAKRAKIMKQYTWRDSCPIPLSELVELHLIYWGFDHQSHEGVLIVNKTLSKEVLDIFHQLYIHHFPIERMQVMDDFHGDDLLAMNRNNSSCFNCRSITNRPGVFSQHSYGRAIDINTLMNPYVKGDQVLPEGGRAYLDRNKDFRGKISKDSLPYQLFTARGWVWGGDWEDRQDYQHFEKPE